MSVGAEIAPSRARVVDALFGPLREERDAVTALTAAREVLAGLRDDQDEQRRLLAERRGNDFSLAELDAEVGYKKLVTVLGGGGGAGFVYIGAMQRLLEAAQVPDYMVGAPSSAARCRCRSRSTSPGRKRCRIAPSSDPRARAADTGVTGLFSLRFDQFADAMFRREDGERMRMSTCQFRSTPLSAIGPATLPLTPI
ncbi:MAG: hypothetical protein QOF31_1400 [Mycobacterium sp.]|nr:hypothetical protein [Mycobacterium sp.]